MRKCCSVKWKYHEQFIIVTCTHIFQQLIMAKWNTCWKSDTSDADDRSTSIDGTLSLGVGSIVDGLKLNRTTSRSVTLAGTIRNNGSCKGTQYLDPYGTWDDVVVQAIARVSLKTS